jgi:hypothetical protein
MSRIVKLCYALNLAVWVLGIWAVVDIIHKHVFFTWH